MNPMACPMSGIFGLNRGGSFGSSARLRTVSAAYASSATAQSEYRTSRIMLRTIVVLQSLVKLRKVAKRNLGPYNLLLVLQTT